MTLPANHHPILEAAREAYRAQLCIVPVAEDGTKRPDVPSWEPFKAARPTLDDMKAFRFADRKGLGMIAGPVSERRGTWDFDDLETYRAFVEAADQCGLGDVIKRIEAGYCDETPNGGRRWIVGYPEALEWKDQTLARRPGREGEPPVKTLIEFPTFAILAPSHGTVHPTGRPYRRLSGGFETIASYTAEEHEALVALARSFDAIPKPAPATSRSAESQSDGHRPGDDFNRRATWADVLEPHGWNLVTAVGDKGVWRRPGKSWGISATTNYGSSDLLYVFTSSTVFEPEKSYTKFGAYTLLEHGGDFAAATRALAAKGYGENRPSREPPRRPPPEASQPQMGADSELTSADSELASATEVGTEKRRRLSQATRLVQLVEDHGVDLFHTPGQQEPYLTVPVNGHWETYRLKDRFSKDWLSRRFYEETRSAPNTSALNDAVTALAGMAKFDGPARPVFVRLAMLDQAIYIDLGDETWQAVKITADGWTVVADCPIRFRRPRGILPLPVPQPGGSVEALRPFLNVASDDDFILAVNWLLAALRPAGPYPLLNITGEQGSAKSTTARILRSLADPNITPLRSTPGTDRDLMIAATNAHVCAFDNISKIPKWLSDAFCRLATGGGFSTRQLYTDDDEALFDAMRPILFTGITDVAIEGDLSDRTIGVMLPVISDRRRQTERDLWAGFEAVKPAILGALLSAVSTALQNLAATKIPEPPRMADFACWGVAAEPSWPWAAGRFLKAFTANRADLIETSLDGSPLADMVRALGSWEGTSKDLLEQLERRVPEGARPRDWYRRPRQLADDLRRLAPLLRKVGIDVTWLKRTPSRRLIRIERMTWVGHDANDGRPDAGHDAESAKDGRNDAHDAHDAREGTFLEGGVLVFDRGEI